MEVTILASPLKEGDPDADGAPCAVCREYQSFENNEIIFCDKCNVAVHQRCYDVAEVPDGAW